MKLYLTLVVLSILPIVACNSNTTEPSATPEKKDDVSPINCYLYTTPTDTVSLKLIHDAGNITGTLVYQFHEKDRNTGTIQGNMQGDLLFANYTFMSEGIQSVRPVVFKKTGNYFVEGYGELDNSNNGASFKNPDSLQFNDKMRLVETDCN